MLKGLLRINSGYQSRGSILDRHTSKEHSDGCKGAIFGLKPLQQRCQCKQINDHMQESHVNKRIRVKAVHCQKVRNS